MDALAGYGSDSDSDSNQQEASKSSGALSGLLAEYSDDEHSDNGTGESNKSNGKDIDKPVERNGEASPTKESSETVTEETQPKKRRRRWDNPESKDDEADAALGTTEKFDDIFPPPRLLSKTSTSTGEESNTGDDPFQSLVLFEKDYTCKLRQNLSNQHRNQHDKPAEQSAHMEKLSKKLDQMYNTFQQSDQHNGTSNTSFAAHLKSKHEFGNPHLLKNIIDHFQISPLESHAGNSFRRFEYVERLMSSEERSRIAAANYQAGMSSGIGGNSADAGVN